MQGYHQFISDGEHFGSFEVAYFEAMPIDESSDFTLAGWYWAACFPGCLPDSDWYGPFATAEEAYANAQGDASC